MTFSNNPKMDPLPQKTKISEVISKIIKWNPSHKKILRTLLKIPKWTPSFKIKIGQENYKNKKNTKMKINQNI